MVNKQLFNIVAMKRFPIGNTAFVGQGVTNINNSHKEVYVRIRAKQTYRATQGNAMALTERELPVTQRFWVLCVSDELTGDAQPAVWTNWNVLHTLDLGS